MCSWERISLDRAIRNGEIELGRGNIISSIDIARHPGVFPVYSSSAKNNGEMARYGSFMFDEELITWSIDGGGTLFYRPKHKYSVTNVCGYLRITDPKWDYRFVHYALEFQHGSMLFDYQTKAHPSVIRHAYSLPVLPLKEQQEIAAVLGAVDRAIEETEALIAKQQRIKTGLMQNLLTRGIDAAGNLRDEVTHAFKESVLGRIPVEWRVGTVAHFGDVMMGRQLSPRYRQNKYPTPYLRVANVFDGWIDYSDVLEMDFTPSEKQRFVLQQGDILLNEGQSLELVGRSAIFDGAEDTYCFQNTLIRYRTYDELLPEYAQLIFKWWLDTGKFQDVARQTTSVAHLGSDRFAKMPMVLPPVEEQALLMKHFSSIDAAIQNYQDQLQLHHRIKTGLMQDLLSGVVSVSALLQEKEAHES